VTKLSEWDAHPRNPRKITDAKLTALGRSMDAYGDLSALVLNRRTNRWLGGHQRNKHLPESAEITIVREFKKPTKRGTVALGTVEWKREPWFVRIVDVSEDAELEMNLAANAERGVWDDPALADLLREMAESDRDVDPLLSGADPHLMVTDPPYGVEYDPDWRNEATRPDGTPYGAGATGAVHGDDRADWKAAWDLFGGDVA